MDDATEAKSGTLLGILGRLEGSCIAHKDIVSVAMWLYTYLEILFAVVGRARMATPVGVWRTKFAMIGNCMLAQEGWVWFAVVGRATIYMLVLGMGGKRGIIIIVISVLSLHSW